MSMPTIPGLDVSHFQNIIDWKRVVASGRVYAFIKASEGAHTPDQLFTQNRIAAHANGAIVGAYHLFHPTVDVDAQVQLFITQIVSLAPTELPPVLDLELPGDWAAIPIDQRAPLVLRWLTKVEALVGIKPIIYASTNFISTILASPAALGAYRLWLANYTTHPTVPAPWTDWTFWQFSDAGTIDGITTPVDLDLFNGTRESFNQLLVPPPAPLVIRSTESTTSIVSST
jgi:lysozyme